MKTKELLLLAGGVAIGYLLFKKDLFKKGNKGLGEITAGASQVVSGAGDVVSATIGTVGDTFQTGGLKPSKQADCEKKWEEFSATAKFTSNESKEKARVSFMNDCLLG